MYTNIFFMVFIFFKLLSTFYFLAKRILIGFTVVNFMDGFFWSTMMVKPGYVTQEIFYIAYSYKNVKFIVEILS